ncbi:MAG: cysteine desulfurase family protein [Pseudomonadota bacterium]
MNGQRAYLDHNATAPLRPEARAAMLDALATVGNPSSVHGEGRDARRLIEVARRQVAGLVNCSPEGVIFTSGATEAAHLGLTPDISVDGTSRPASQLYVLETEHPCVLTGGRFAPEQVQGLPVDSNGLIDLDGLDSVLQAHDFDAGLPFVAVQLANSETGVIQPVAEIAQRVRFKGGYVLCDAVQAVGRMPVDLSVLGVDFLLLSSHKLGGPQGAGALVVVHDSVAITPAILGGGQELNRRAGTENVAALAGMGAAAEVAGQRLVEYNEIATLRDSLAASVVTICQTQGIEDRLTVFGAEAPRLANTLLFSLEGHSAETALIAFDLAGVAVSSGSACSSGKVGSSHVLQAMDVAADKARGAIRVSLGWNSTERDVEQFCRAFETVAKRYAAQAARDDNENRISGAA